jgi:glycosyltransferase involved in cell wall biosynthesis
VYDGEKYLVEALESVLAQSFEDFELVISDNASTDRTSEICRDYSLKDGRIRYYRNETNLGAAVNYNRVFELSTGSYFKWISHDDLSAPAFLENCVEILDRDRGVVLCYPKTVLINEKGQETSYYNDKLNLTQEKPHKRLASYLDSINLANAVFGLIRSETLRKTRLIGSYTGSDYVLLLEVCLNGKFHEVPKYLFFRRDHGENVRKLPGRERWKWFNPNMKKPVLNYNARIFLEMFKAVEQSELPNTEKFLCYCVLPRWEIRRLRALGGRYKSALKKKLHMDHAILK